MNQEWYQDKNKINNALKEWILKKFGILNLNYIYLFKIYYVLVHALKELIKIYMLEIYSILLYIIII